MGWMYSVYQISPIGGTGGKMGWWGKNMSAVDWAPYKCHQRLSLMADDENNTNFIKNGSVVTENDQFSAGR